MDYFISDDFMLELIFVILLWLLLRPIYLWYVGISKIHESLEKNNKLLEQLYLHMGGKIKDEIPLKNNRYKNDNARIEELKINLKADEVIVKTLENGMIDKWKYTDWDEVVKLGNANKFQKLS